MPKISVIIPTYWYSHFGGQAVPMSLMKLLGGKLPKGISQKGRMSLCLQRSNKISRLMRFEIWDLKVEE